MKTKPEIRIGPDLSITTIEGDKAIYAGHLFTLNETDPDLFAQITPEQLDDCAAKHPELAPALQDFLATHNLPPTTRKK